MVRIDPHKPGLIACIRGSAGLTWLIFTRSSVTVLVFLFVVATWKIF
jgi:hypothetical protein